MNTRKIRMTALIRAIGLSGTAQADLQGRDLNGSIDSFEAYYDTDLDITWLANANVNGGMLLGEAYTWAANLSFTDGVNTYDNWRLPTTLQPDATCGVQAEGAGSYGYGCTGSEMGYLFREVGGEAGLSLMGNANYYLFSNLLSSFYWSSTENANDTRDQWAFKFFDGFQSGVVKSTTLYALAVSPGDVAAVPESETYAMMLAGLGLVVSCRDAGRKLRQILGKFVG